MLFDFVPRRSFSHRVKFAIGLGTNLLSELDVEAKPFMRHLSPTGLVVQASSLQSAGQPEMKRYGPRYQLDVSNVEF